MTEDGSQEEPVKAEIPEIPDDAPTATEAGAVSDGELYAGHPKLNLQTDVAGKTIIVAEAKFLPSSFNQGTEFAVMLCKEPGGEPFTCSSGSGAIVDKLKVAKFPFKTKIVFKQGQQGEYAAFADPD